MRPALLFALPLLASCAAAASAAIVEGSVTGISPRAVQAAVRSFCVDHGSGPAVTQSELRTDCIVSQKPISFEVGRGRTADILNVVSLDAKTPEPELRRYLDAVLSALSNAQ